LIRARSAAALFAVAALSSGVSMAQQAPDEPADRPSRQPGDGLAVGPLRVLPSIGLSIGYDDNLSMTSRDEESSAFWRVSPGVRVEGGSERNRVRATLDAEVGRYTSSSVDDYEDYGADLAWLYSPLLRHAFVLDAGRRFGHDARGTAAREGDLGLLDLDVDRFRRDDLGGRYRFGAPGARGRVELEARVGGVDYLNNRELTAFRDRDDTKLGGAFFWRVAPKTSAELRIEREEYDYELATLDSTEDRVLVGVEFDATARTTGSVLVGRATKDFDDPTRSDFSGSTWRANVEWRPRSYSIFSVSTGGEADETNGFGDYILRRDLTFGWTHNWSARFRTSVDAGLADEEQRPTDRTDRVRYVGAAADYAFRRWLRGGASWRMYDRASDVDEFDYRRNVLLLSLEASL
jgi:hypothetical protein